MEKWRPLIGSCLKARNEETDVGGGLEDAENHNNIQQEVVFGCFRAFEKKKNR